MPATSRIVTECGSCGSQSLDSILFLGYMQPACSMPKIGDRPKEEAHFPLELLRCSTCTLVQLSCIVDPSIIFHKDYPYSSGNTKALRENFADLAKEATEAADLQPTDLVVDIGANDGTLLSNFACRVLAVDPTDQVQTARAKGMPVYQGFFSKQVAQALRHEFGSAKLITACNVLAHVEDIHSVLEGIVDLLADDGMLVTENHWLGSVVGNQWDTIYHEHLRYYDFPSLWALLKAHGLTPVTVRSIPTHGGSLRVAAVKSLGAKGAIWWSNDDEVDQPVPVDALDSEVADSCAEIQEAVAHAQREGRVWGIGAAARGATLLNACGLNLEAVCEVAGSDKIGHYMPGTTTPVVDEAEFYQVNPESAILLSWHLADFLVPKMRAKGYAGNIIVPLPRVQTLRPDPFVLPEEMSCGA